MKLLIFGTGRFFEKRRKALYEHSIVGFIDNDCNKWGKTIDGVTIHYPKQGVMLDYDTIILMSAKSGEMKQQLLEQLGIEKSRIMLWEEFQALLDKGHLELYSANTDRINKKEKILVISQDLDYSGGPLTAVYAAMALYNCGYQVCLAAPGGKDDFIHEVNEIGIDVLLYKNLCYASWEEITWIRSFQFVIVNTVLMLHCAMLINREMPLFWWIHEVSELYENVNSIDPYRLKCDVSNIKSFAVSDIARNNFKRYFQCNDMGILPYGIPDRKSAKPLGTTDKNKIIIAIIGPVYSRKGQDVFLKAIKKLDLALRTHAEFWIIGDLLESTPFAMNILKESEKLSNITLKGRMTRKEIEQIYDKIDVVVCASREETMSMTITEGMMFGKVCVTSDAAGIAAFIQNGENGFVFESENYIELSQKLSEIVNNRYDLGYIGRNARKTYLDNFTMEKFGERLEQIMRGMYSYDSGKSLPDSPMGNWCKI